MSNPIYISIGAQCTTTELFEKIGVKRESLPFDWIFTTPEFVYIILKLLIIDNLDISDIIDNYFFVCDTAGYVHGVEHYYDAAGNIHGVEHYTLDPNGPVPINSKYGVAFSHYTKNDRDIFARRLERLKKLLLDKNNFLYLVYVSVSSKVGGNYTINGIEPIQDIHGYINKICDILKTITNSFKILVFDTGISGLSDTVTTSDNKFIYLYKLEEKNTRNELFPELLTICTTLIKNNIIRIS